MVGSTKRAPRNTRAQAAVADWRPQHRRFTADEYDRMVEAGILHEDEHIELIDGEIVLMAPMGSKHARCVLWLNRWFTSRLVDRALVSPQIPVHLGDNSEPEPDLALLRERADLYGTALAQPADVLLAVEVADTTLAYDRTVKHGLYAQAGIPEFWIVDLVHEQVLVHREPHEGQYTRVEAVARGGTVAPLAFPDLSADVSDIFGER